MPKKMMFALIAIAVLSWGCGGEGCGGDPKASSSAQAPAAASGKGAPGGGEVGLAAPQSADGSKAESGGKVSPDGSRFDTAGAQGSSNKASEQAQEAAGAKTDKPQKLEGPQTIFDVDPPGFSRVLNAALPALVIVQGPNCADCDLAMPMLRTLSKDQRGKMEFYRIDATAMGASGVLPAGTLAPLPAFVLYEKGKPVTTRSGLPFPREKATKDRPEEPELDYQRRLFRWFRDALAQKNLKFGAS